MNEYGTHLPILEVVCDTLEKSGSNSSIYEYGMGMFSTKLFEKRFHDVISVEMQDESWFLKMKNEKMGENVQLYCFLGATAAIDFFKSINKCFSCIFVDGHGATRWQCINEAFYKTDIIVTHDTETFGYHWNRVKLPKDYVWIDIIDYNPWTSVITRNADLISAVSDKFKTRIRNFTDL